MVVQSLTFRSNDNTNTHTFEYVTRSADGETHRTTGTIHCRNCANVIVYEVNRIIADAVLTRALEITTDAHTGGEV